LYTPARNLSKLKKLNIAAVHPAVQNKQTVQSFQAFLQFDFVIEHAIAKALYSAIVVVWLSLTKCENC
jgi:hypothetical protein